MKILLEISEKFTEPEIHICNGQKNEEVIKLKDTIDELLDEKITVYQKQEMQKVAGYDIVRIFSENKKVYLRTEEELFEVRDRLYSLEETFSKKGFVRISNSEIVNIRKILKLDMSHAGTIKMHMKNGDTTFVSRRYVSRIKELLTKEL